MAKLYCQQPLLALIIFLFGAQETYVNVENTCSLIFCELFEWKKNVFIWNKIICNIINVFNVTFDQFNAFFLTMYASAYLIELVW